MSWDQYDNWRAAGRVKNEPVNMFLPADADFQFTVICKLPPSVNHYKGITQTGKVYKTDAAKIYQQEFAAAAQIAGARLVDGPVTIRVIIRAEPSRIDIDNAQKLIFDALIGIVYTDDKAVWGLSVKRQMPEPGEKPYAIVRIERFKE